MARHYKKWEEHSARWQREQSRKGLSKGRWDGWLKLSDKTRKTSDPFKYASGQPIAAQRRERKERAAYDKIRQSSSRTARLSTIRNNVRKMSDADLDWTIKASPQAIRNRASKAKINGYHRNPWWYM